MSDEAEDRVCAVCRRVLARVDLVNGTVEYAHELQDRIGEDHRAVPVTRGEVPGILRCDFCNQDDPTYVIPARSFTVAPGQGSRGNWAACQICADLVRRNDWKGLVRRALQRYSPFMGSVADREALATMLLHSYRKLRANITGPPRLSE